MLVGFGTDEFCSQDAAAYDHIAPGMSSQSMQKQTMVCPDPIFMGAHPTKQSGMSLSVRAGSDLNINTYVEYLSKLLISVILQITFYGMVLSIFRESVEVAEAHSPGISLSSLAQIRITLSAAVRLSRMAGIRPVMLLKDQEDWPVLSLLRPHY